MVSSDRIQDNLKNNKKSSISKQMDKIFIRDK